MKKILVLMLLGVSFTLTFTACGNDNQKETASEKDIEEDIEEDEEDEDDDSKHHEIEFALDLSTEDIYGHEVGNEIVAGASLVMINYWEPWCGPCVGELPDLQKLYENYKDEGLVIIGVYSSVDMTSDAKDIIESSGIKYPVIKATKALSVYMSDYVPTTVFLDAEGNLLSEEQYIGSRSYNEWAGIVEGYLD